jgi:hypothetical protein
MGVEDKRQEYSGSELLERHPNLKYSKLDQITRFEEERVDGSNNITRISLYRGKEVERLFKVVYCKEFEFRAGNENLSRAYDRDPARLFRTEDNSYNTLENTCMTQWLPRVMGKDPDNLKLYLSEMKGVSSQDRLLNSKKLDDDLEEMQIILTDAVKKYGIIEGALLSHKDKFKPTNDYSVERRLQRLTDYVGTILRHSDSKLANEKSTGTLIELARERYQSRGINLPHLLGDIANTSCGLVNTLRPSVGDARLRHLFSNVHGFGTIDNEYMGWHPRVHTLVTLTNDIAGISRPKDQDLRAFISTYLAYYDVAFEQYQEIDTNKKDNKGFKKRNMIKNLNRKIRKSSNKNKRIIEEASKNNVIDRVFLEYIAMDIEENIHMYASCLRSSEEALQSWVKEIEGYTVENMIQYRLDRIQDNFNLFIGEKENFLDSVEEATTFAFESLLTKYALLLDRLDIVKIESPLLRSHGGSYRK